MTSVRSLPVRVPPIAGEAIDSWLEALAAWTHTTWYDLLTAIGLSTAGPSTPATDKWIVGLLPQQGVDLAAATGLNSAELAMMTLSHYDGRALEINTNTRKTLGSHLWRQGTGSRYCPRCLAESDGRWPIAWRLGWTFACLRHRCLLRDTCPCCLEVPRVYTPVGILVPTPNLCARKPLNAPVGTLKRCGTDLRKAGVQHFRAGHPVLHAQHIIDQVIATAVAQFGVYQHDPQSSLGVLADIRALSGRMMAYGTDAAIAARLPDDITDTYFSERRARTGQGLSLTSHTHPAPGSAVTAAAAVVIALSCLNRDSITAAGDAVRWLFRDSHARGITVSSQALTWGQRTTETLTAVQIAGVAPMLKRIVQFRYRAASSTPTRPPRGFARAHRIIRNTPTMFWPEWTLRLTVPRVTRRQLPPTLAAITLLVGTRLTFSQARHQLRLPIASIPRGTEAGLSGAEMSASTYSNESVDWPLSPGHSRPTKIGVEGQRAFQSTSHRSCPPLSTNTAGNFSRLTKSTMSPPSGNRR